MRIKSKRIGMGLLFLLITFTVASTVDAGYFGRKHSMARAGGGLMGLKTLIALDLSDDQELKIMEIIEKYQDQRQSTKNILFDARKTLADALQAEEFNEDAIRNAHRQVSSIREEMLVSRAKMMAEMKTVLTPEQIELLKERRSQRIEKLKNRFDNWEQQKTY